MTGNLTLGLDLGTNSIGWALIVHDENGDPSALKDCGSRIFQEAVDAKTRTPKNKARRGARAARRQLSRRKHRRQALSELLVENGLLPKDESELHALLLDDKECNPYLLRKKGLDERLDLHEFGRVLAHLNRRRGFKSNRKAQLSEIFKEYPDVMALVKKDEGDDASLTDAGRKAARQKAIRQSASLSTSPPQKSISDEEGIVKEAISALRQGIAEYKCRTLGEYLYVRGQGLASETDQGTYSKKVRKLHADRSMYEEEFEKLWGVQQQYHPEVLTDGLRAQTHNVIFYQRPLKVQKFLVGRCPFEPTRKRAAKALLEVQRFRMFQDINNLTVKDPLTRNDRRLTERERKLLLQKLEEQESLSWSKVRKVLGVHEGERLNLEEGGKDKLIGNRTVIAMRKICPEWWDSLSAVKQQELLTDLLTIDRKDALLRRLIKHWQLDVGVAYRLTITELEPGYASLSFKAINKLLPHLEGGLNYYDACFAAGYVGSTQEKKTSSLDKLPAPSNLRNPVVQRALHQTRHVVNAIIRRYGKPSVIRVELARDLKLGKKEKEEAFKRSKQNERLNAEARATLIERGIGQPSRDDLTKYRLWKECAAQCPYTGKAISLEMLFTAEVDVEHIIPYSLCLDDSYMNKTLCLAIENRQVKKQRSPYDAYSGDPAKYQEILQRLSHMSMMPFGKRRKFEMKDFKLDDFIARQLNDTRYISVEVKDYLSQLGTEVAVSKGGATAALRHRWKLNAILAVDGDYKKNRADHRHHAIDAIVVALTSTGLMHKLSKLSAVSHYSLGSRDFKVPDPWQSFHNDVKAAVGKILVSHAPQRKITGAFHEDTAYGPTHADGVFVYRKALEGISASEIENIRDNKVKELVKKHLAECGNDIKKAFGNSAVPLLHLDGKTPIKSVRLAVKKKQSTLMSIRDSQDVEYKFFAYGNNHHVEVVADSKTGNWVFFFVTAVEAAARARRRKESVVCRNHGSDYSFVMSLAPNDMLEIENDEGKYYRLQKLDASADRLVLQLHTATQADDKSKSLQKRARPLQLLNCKKISVDALGSFTYCHHD